jgi:hypothetical protein
MSGLLHSSILSFPSETRVFELLRGSAPVTKTIVEPPSANSGYLRGVGTGVSFESTGVLLFNPTASPIDFRVEVVDPDGPSNIGSGTLTAQNNQFVNAPFPILSDEFVTATILPSSVGDRVNVFATFSDVSVKRERTKIDSEWKSVFPESSAGQILSLLGFAIVVFGGLGGATVEFRLVKEGFPTLKLGSVVVGPDSYAAANGIAPSLQSGERCEARLVAGTTAIVSVLYLPRPKTHPSQMP